LELPHNKQVSPPAEVYQIYAYAAQNGELALFLVAAAACPTKATAYARIFGLPELRRRSLCIGTPMHAKSLALDFTAALLVSRMS
jgi:hypothetical protein